MFYSQLGYLLVTVFLLYKLIKKDYNLFQVLIFVLPFHSWIYNIGLNLTIFQIITFVVLLSAAIKGRNILYVGNITIGLFFLFAIIDTIIISVFFIDEYQNLGGFFRSEGRYLAQMVLLSITFAIIPLAFNYIKKMEDVQKYLSVYLSALILLALLGWIQYFTYSISGIDLFPLSINQFGDVRSGLYNFEGSKIFRMSSLGGEPKGFSMSLILGFFIIHIFNRQGISIFKYDVPLKYLFLFTAFSTLSTSGMVLFSILFFVNIIYQTVKSKKDIKINSKSMLYGIVIFLIIVFLFIRYWDFVSLIVEQRVFERDVTSEDYDAPIQIFLSKFPEYLLFGSGLGNIHNLAYPYIPRQYLHYMGDSIFLAKSGYLRITSELGLIGLSLFVFMIYNTYRKLGTLSMYLNYEDRQFLYAMQLLLVLTLMAYFARTYLSGELFLFLAMANVIVYSKVIRQKVSR